MPIQVPGVLVHVMSGTELSRARTKFQLRLPEPVNKSPLESRGPTLLCNQVPYCCQTSCGLDPAAKLRQKRREIGGKSF